MAQGAVELACMQRGRLSEVVIRGHSKWFLHATREAEVVIRGHSKWFLHAMREAEVIIRGHSKWLYEASARTQGTIKGQSASSPFEIVPDRSVSHSRNRSITRCACLRSRATMALCTVGPSPAG